MKKKALKEKHLEEMSRLLKMGDEKVTHPSGLSSINWWKVANWGVLVIFAALTIWFGFWLRNGLREGSREAKFCSQACYVHNTRMSFKMLDDGCECEYFIKVPHSWKNDQDVPAK